MCCDELVAMMVLENAAHRARVPGQEETLESTSPGGAKILPSAIGRPSSRSRLIYLGLLKRLVCSGSTAQ